MSNRNSVENSIFVLDYVILKILENIRVSNLVSVEINSRKDKIAVNKILENIIVVRQKNILVIHLVFVEDVAPIKLVIDDTTDNTIFEIL